MKLEEKNSNAIRAAFHNFGHLYSALSNIENLKNEQTSKYLKDTILAVGGCDLLLPSGRYGNALAVAFEMQMYISALFILQNAQELNIDLDIVSYTDYKDVWSAKEAFAFSLKVFDTTKIEESDERYKLYPTVIKFNNDTIEAAKEIKEILQVSRKR